MLKKIVSILAAFAMFAIMAMPVFAEETNSIKGDGYTITFDKATTKKEEVMNVYEDAVDANGNYTQTVSAQTVTVYQLPAGKNKITITTTKPNIGATYFSYVKRKGGKDFEAWQLGRLMGDNRLAPVSGTEIPVNTPWSIIANYKDCGEIIDNYESVEIGYLDGKTVDLIYFRTSLDGVSAPAENAAPPANTTAPADTTAPAENTAQKPVLIPFLAATEDITYTVKAGDTLGLLSLNNYGSYNYWDELYNANAAVLKASNGKIYQGLNIVIPATIAKNVSVIAPATVGEGEKLYTVKSGDTLGTIAQTIYGNSNKYKDIFERNADRLANANTIYTGQVIVLPVK